MSKVDKLLDEIGSLTVLEASELKTKMEETFGVSAAAPVAVAAAGAPAVKRRPNRTSST
jgi:large subunit ribosomal protein L7/L12